MFPDVTLYFSWRFFLWDAFLAWPRWRTLLLTFCESSSCFQPVYNAEYIALRAVSAGQSWETVNSQHADLVIQQRILRGWELITCSQAHNNLSVLWSFCKVERLSSQTALCASASGVRKTSRSNNSVGQRVHVKMSFVVLARKSQTNLWVFEYSSLFGTMARGSRGPFRINQSKAFFS